MNVESNFPNNKCFGFPDIGYMGLMGNTIVGMKGEASSIAIPTHHRTSIFGLSIDKYRVFHNNMKRLAHRPAFLLHSAISATGVQVLVSGL